MEGGAERDLGGLDRAPGRVVREARALLPHGLFEQTHGVLVLRRETTEKGDAGKNRCREGAEQRVADHRATAEAGLFVRSRESLDDRFARLLGSARKVALLDPLVIVHDRLGPVDRADATPIASSASAMPRPMKRLLCLTATRSPSSMGNSM